MGHAFQHTIMDALIRHQRMQGANTLWVPGTDHAGIATQIVVERQLQDAGLSRHDLGRKKFIDQVWDWKETSGSTITRQMRRMGDSVAWKYEYFTMDERLSAVVTETFVSLYEEGLIYRGKRLVNWDPVLLSAVSDLEVVSEERDGTMWHILYPFSDGPQADANGQPMAGMHIATTRPETMLADGALAVHPDDDRYRHLIGKLVDLPLCDRRIPIIADDFVDREFGSGCVKITGAHDFNDYACALRHGIPLITIFTLDAKINENGPVAYQGLDRYDARKAVLRDLEAQHFLEKAVPHKHAVPVCERTGEVVEPMLTDQWFVAMTKAGADGTSLAGKAIDAVETGAVKFFPEQWINTYNQWMKNIQDWTISRQLWWGHQIPAWYGDDGELFVARSEDDARAQGRGRRLQRRADARSRRPRHLVLVGAGAVLVARLAEEDRGAGAVPALVGARHRLRHHLLLGRPDDHDDAALHRSGAVPRRLHPRPGARRAGQADEQVGRQRARSGRPDRRHRPRAAARQALDRPAPARDRAAGQEGHRGRIPERHSRLRRRCAALHLRLARQPGPQRQLRLQALRGLPQLLQQALERDPLRAA